VNHPPGVSNRAGRDNRGGLPVVVRLARVEAICDTNFPAPGRAKAPVPGTGSLVVKSLDDVLASARTNRAAAIFLVAVFVLVGGDVIEDYQAGAHFGHMLLEMSLEGLVAFGLVALWRGMIEAREHSVNLERDLALSKQETERWRNEAHGFLRGLGEAIDRQFERWSLTSAEREIGLLLLKGLSHKEIASIRKTNEQTVRQQALSLYRKARLSGRNDLSAFFLEDLLLPSQPEAGGGGG